MRRSRLVLGAGYSASSTTAVITAQSRRCAVTMRAGPSCGLSLTTAAREASDAAAAYKMETVAATADLTTATVSTMRGDHDQVAPLLASTLATVDAADYRVHGAGPARRRPRGAGRRQLPGRLRAAQPALRRRRQAAAPPRLLPRDRRPRRRRGARGTPARGPGARDPRLPSLTRRPARGWSSSPPAPAGCSPNPQTPRVTSARACPIPPETAGG